MKSRSADEIVDEVFLDVRAKLLEIAATLDRIDRAVKDDGELDDESEARRQKLLQATEILLSDEADRAERLQHLFSRPYQSDWREAMKI